MLFAQFCVAITETAKNALQQLEGNDIYPCINYRGINAPATKNIKRKKREMRWKAAKRQLALFLPKTAQFHFLFVLAAQITEQTFKPEQLEEAKCVELPGDLHGLFETSSKYQKEADTSLKLCVIRFLVSFGAVYLSPMIIWVLFAC